MAKFQNNFTEMFLGWPSTKIAKMVRLHLKMAAKAKNSLEKPWNNISF